MSRRPWKVTFTAESEEVPSLRRILRLHLRHWGLHDVIDAAQLCLSELVSNVIAHVGHGTPTTLAVSMEGTRLRLEVHDPDTRSLPTLIHTGVESETGRGVALINALAEHWGVRLLPDRKETWCELATALTSPNGHVEGPGVQRAEALLEFYAGSKPSLRPGSGRLARTVAEESVISVITDFLHWLRAHGCDVDETLDRAQNRYDAELGSHG